jgi:hypothetical protein
MPVDLPCAVESALSLGWSIIPCGRNKKPLLGAWREFQKRPATRAEVENWYLKLKPPSWAVVTGAVSGLVVLDADTFAAINYIKQLGLQPNIKTGSGGYHVYFDHPGFPVHTLNSKSKLELWEKCPGLDIRADGGYALFSGTNQTGPYEVLLPLSQRSPLNILPDDMRKGPWGYPRPAETEPAAMVESISQF